MIGRGSPHRAVYVLAVAALALLGAGCGGGNGSSSDLQPGHVDVKDNYFDPKSVAISVGDTVTWTFRGKVTHNVSGPGFTSETVKTGTFEHTFEKAGSFNYVCTIHTGMTGTVEVA